MNIKGKNVLVTGAGGFIGSHLVEKLHSAGANVTCFVKYNSRNHWGYIEEFSDDIRKDINIFQGDIRDSYAVHKATKNMDFVFHLAALIGVPYSYTNPKENFQTNVMGTVNVMNACMDNGVKKIVHTSTSEVYGTPKRVPIKEEDLLQGQSPYSASKIGADMVAQTFYYSFDLPVGIMRPFNAYGPRQSARAIIPTIITQALVSDKIVVGNLEPTRDYNYVKDIVDAYILFAESEKTAGEVINIGTGSEIKLKEALDKILKIVGTNKEVAVDKTRIRPEKSEVMRLTADNTKARKILGWEPKTNFDDGLRKTVDYIKRNLEIYKYSIYNI